jgi:hypothetical protein
MTTTVENRVVFLFVGLILGAFGLFMFQGDGISKLSNGREEFESHEPNGIGSDSHFDEIAFMKQAKEEMRQRRMAQQIVAESRFQRSRRPKLPRQLSESSNCVQHSCKRLPH